jgi:hypothetical protein
MAPNNTNLQMAKDGVFVTLEQMRITGQLDPAKAARSYKKTFTLVQELVVEAQKELVHLAKVMERTGAACRSGMDRYPGTFMSSEYGILNQELLTATAWMASFVETVMTIQTMIQPAAVPVRIDQLATALRELHNKRVQSGLLLDKDASLFKPLTEVT